MPHFDPQKYRSYLLEEKEKLSRRASELKIKIGQEEGPMQSWSRPAQKALEQELEVTLIQLEAIENKLKEFTALAEGKKPPRDAVSPGAVVIVRTNGRKERILIVAGSGDPRFGVLSINSPVGQALIGRRSGEKVKMSISGKVSEWEILKIE